MTYEILQKTITDYETPFRVPYYFHSEMIFYNSIKKSLFILYIQNFPNGFYHTCTQKLVAQCTLANQNFITWPIYITMPEKVESDENRLYAY